MRWNSPYINHFTQPDTIIPDQTSPQGWDRYAYVNNNPLRYTDPTGHTRVEDAGSRKGCSDPKYCKGRDSNGKLKPKIKRERGGSSTGSSCTDPGKCGGTVYSHGLDDPLLFWGGEYDGNNLASWDGVKQIDPAQWNGLLKDVGDHVNNFSLGLYDTPLYDGYGSLSGKACIPGGKCYDRSELNYIGEGEALAALGLSKQATHNVVWAWKNKEPLVLGSLGLDSTPREVSQGTHAMTDVGWDYYHQHYSEPSLTLRSLVFPPVIAPALSVP